MPLLLEHSGKTLQESLEAQRKDAVVELPPREFRGPIVLKNSIVINGGGATIWARQGPVLTLKSKGIVLRHLKIEVTDETAGKRPEERSAILSKVSDVRFENVEVRGAVLGLPNEEGDWHYPISLPLGQLADYSGHEFKIRVVAPVPCRVVSTFSGLKVDPPALRPGPQEVRLYLDRQPQDAWINAYLILTTSLMRRIGISAHILSEQNGEAARGRGETIWTPEQGFVPLIKPETEPESSEPILVPPPIVTVEQSQSIVAAPAPSREEVVAIPVYPASSAPTPFATAAAPATSPVSQPVIRIIRDQVPANPNLFKPKETEGTVENQTPGSQNELEKAGKGRLSGLFLQQSEEAQQSSLPPAELENVSKSAPPRPQSLSTVFVAGPTAPKNEEASKATKEPEPARPEKPASASKAAKKSVPISPLFGSEKTEPSAPEKKN